MCGDAERGGVLNERGGGLGEVAPKENIRDWSPPNLGTLEDIYLAFKIVRHVTLFVLRGAFSQNSPSPRSYIGVGGIDLGVNGSKF